VKSAHDMENGEINDARSFERLLRENGFSRSRAKTITAKGFKATDFAADESAEIAHVVAELKTRRDRLEEKRRSKKFFSRAEALADIISVIEKAYRKSRGTPQPIRLFEGQEAKFDLGLRNLFRPKVQVVMPPVGFHYYECNIHYWAWTRNGPDLKQAFLYFRPNQNQSQVGLETGSFSDMKSWVSRQIKEVTNKEGGREYDNLELLDRLRAFIDSPAPRGTLTYKKFFLEGPIGDDMRKSRHGFKIVAR